MCERRVFVAAMAMLVAGCSFVPPYQRPPLPTPPSFPVSEAVTPAPADWRTYYPDARLTALIEAALAHNRDLAAAYARVAEARANAAMARAERLPPIEGNASASRSRTPADVTGMNRERTASRFDVNLGVTSFELDFWGRLNALSDAARAQYLASEEAARSFRVSLIGEVAATWYLLNELDTRLRLAQQSLDSRLRSLELTRRRQQAGLASELDVAAAESLVATARSDAADLARQKAQAINALQLLTGMAVTVAAPEEVSLPEPLAAGLPAEVLTRRPDVRAAEQQLLAANFNVGAARAAMFPRITLTAAFGTASAALGDLFAAGSQAWNLATGARGPLIDFGRNQANTEAAEARRAAALANYEKTLQQAFREVADALAAENEGRHQVAAQEELVRAQEARLARVRARENAGVASDLEVLDAQRSVFAARQTLAASRRQLATARVTLYKALGGGAE
ncbi:efflux transporter outer membrane subunit [Thiobacter aerophilum]|uniref:Efflux transporter outer membrane subunit n=1 Tax=Thiobacter aerophilum TaxID=3121275 RepID=A0ABV0EH85_9BURK